MVAQADATLYGSLRLNLSNYDGNDLNFSDNASRIGIKGSTELFSGAKAIFQFEQFVSTESGSFGYLDMDSSTFDGGRLASVGITGDFGTVNAGRQWSPFAIWTIFPTDILINSDNSGNSGYQPGLHRLNNTIAYISPAMNGLTFAAVAMADGTDHATTVDANDEDLDAYNIAVKYSVDGLTVAASTIGLEPSGDTVNSIAASYKTGGLYVAARYQEDETVATAGNEDSYELAAKYTMDKTTVAANFIDNDNVADDAYSLEVSQKLGKAATAFVGYYDKGATDSLAVGYRVDF
jgi:predicted porin